MRKTNRMPGGKPQSAREVALSVLYRVDAQGAYSGLELNQALQAAGLARPDAALATELVYGTIQRLNTIDHALQSRVKGWPRKIEPWVRGLLRMSYYQLRWLTRVPAHAAVDEAVRIAKNRGHAGIGGLVNGVLRGLLREGFDAPLPPGLPAAERIALEHSHPQWLVERWLAEYGEEATERMCAANNEPPRASARVNALRKTREQALAELAASGADAKPSLLAKDGIVVSKAGNLAFTDGYKQGELTVQDESSMLVARVAAPEPGMEVLDCCAAPGGKTTHLAELMNDEGRIVANDVHPHKEALIRSQADRLGLKSIGTMSCDASELPVKLSPEAFDLVLLDAPCSGLGVIRRKPEIKWNKTAEDVNGLSGLQGRLLDSAARMVKRGGTLVYSTCTVAAEENERAVRGFLDRSPEFVLDPEWPDEALAPLREAGLISADFPGMFQLLPHQFGSDGFFIARMKKR